MIGKLIPNYTFEDETGSSGKSIYQKRISWLLSIGLSEPQRLPFHTEPRMTKINPFRDLQHGGSSINWKGNNLWISDKCFVGKLLRPIFL